MRLYRRMAVNPVDAQESIRVGTTLLGIYGLITGSTMFLWVESSRELDDRYSALIETPGSLTFWSSIIVLSSLVLTLGVVSGWKRIVAGTLFFGGVWNLAFAAGFFASFLDHPDITPLSFVAMSLIGIAHCEKAILVWSSRKIDLVLLTGTALVKDKTDDTEG
jgi:hypothetical protein